MVRKIHYLINFSNVLKYVYKMCTYLSIYNFRLTNMTDTVKEISSSNLAGYVYEFRSFRHRAVEGGKTLD